jgi:hypothetical protein
VSSKNQQEEELELTEDLDFNRLDFGIANSIWQNAIDEAFQILIKRAKKRQLINYLELANLITSIDFNDPNFPFYRIVPYIVGEISVEEHKKGHPLLSAIVVNNQTHVPGNGFYKLAQYLGDTVTDKDVYASQEIKNCFTFWRAQK